MIALHLHLLTGRYYAARHFDREEAEWPPHPARVVSALVAALHDGDEVDPQERGALQELVALSPPQIAASVATRRSVAKHYVPVNDVTVTGGGNDELARQSEALEHLDAARLSQTADRKQAMARAEKAVRDAGKRLEAAGTAANRPSGPSEKPPSADTLDDAVAVLPSSRLRQERFFPSVTPLDATVVFSWPDGQLSPDGLSALDRLAARVTRVGHSASLTSVRATDAAVRPTLIPDAAGPLALRTCGPGHVELLEQLFEQHQGTWPRVLPYRATRYQEVEVPSEEPPGGTLSKDWLVLRRVDGARLPLIRGVELAATLRATLIRAANGQLPTSIGGHLADGGAARGAHVAFVSLPYVGSQYADGAVMGVALIPPLGQSRSDREQLLAVLGACLDETTGHVALTTGRSGLVTFVFDGREPAAATLRPDTWVGPSTRWASVTPVALDRNPGKLFAPASAVAEAANTAACASISAALERSGYPPARVTVTFNARWRGSRPAHAFGPFPRDPRPGKPRRVLVHADLEFDQPVQGPILIGAGRFLGLGLFRPVPGGRS